MKYNDKLLSGILAGALVAGAFVWVAWAQTGSSARSTSALSSTAVKADCPPCPACPATGTSTTSTTVKAEIGNNSCLSLAGTAVYMDSPAVLLARAEAIGLTDAQKQTLQGIVNQARQDAFAVLTSEQKASMGEISPDPVVIGAILPQTQKSQTTAVSASEAACGFCSDTTDASSSACCLSETTQ